MQCIGFRYILPSLIAVLIWFSKGQASHNQQCENCCMYLDSKIIHMEFHGEARDFNEAQRACSMSASVLLAEEMYDYMKDCIHKYINDTNPLTLWLDGRVEDSSLMQAPTFSLTKKSFSFKEEMKHNFICIRQDKVFKTFRLTVETSAGHKLMNLLAPPWTDRKVFTDVSVGQNVTLTCEAEGIPHPQMIFKKNGNEIGRSVIRSNTSLSIELSVDRCGNLGTFTCEDKANSSNLSKSVTVTVPCEKNKPLFSYDWDQISCSVEEGSYTDVKIVKQFDEKPLPIIKVGDKFITEVNRSCDVMGTYICVARLKDGTTRNRTIDVEYDNCSPLLCPGEVQGQTVQAAPGKKSKFSFCVIAHPNISNFLIFNNTAVYKNGDPNFNWNYTESSFLSSFIVTVTIDNVTSLSYGKLTIGIFTSQSKENQLNYTVILEREGNSPVSQDHDKTTSNPGKDSLSLANQLSLMQVAFVLATFSITCIVVGFILYKKRV